MKRTQRTRSKIMKRSSHDQAEELKFLLPRVFSLHQVFNSRPLAMLQAASAVLGTSLLVCTLTKTRAKSAVYCTSATLELSHVHRPHAFFFSKRGCLGRSHIPAGGWLVPGLLPLASACLIPSNCCQTRFATPCVVRIVRNSFKMTTFVLRSNVTMRAPLAKSEWRLKSIPRLGTHARA